MGQSTPWPHSMHPPSRFLLPNDRFLFLSLFPPSSLFSHGGERGPTKTSRLQSRSPARSDPCGREVPCFRR